MAAASREVVDIEVTLPGRSRGAARPDAGARAPMARVELVLEDGETRALSLPVRVGRILSEQLPALPADADDVIDAVRALEDKVCFTVLCEMLSRREHGVEEARGKLERSGYREQGIQAALERAQSLHYLDEGRFVRNFIEVRKARGWGRRKIELELKRRGVNLDSVDGYPDAFFSDDDDLARASALLARRRVPDSDAFQKLVRHLMGKGFSYCVAAQAARERLAADEQS